MVMGQMINQSEKVLSYLLDFHQMEQKWVGKPHLNMLGNNLLFRRPASTSRATVTQGTGVAHLSGQHL